MMSSGRRALLARGGALGLVVALTGCAGGPDDSPSTRPTASTSTATSTSSSSTATTSADAYAQELVERTNEVRTAQDLETLDRSECAQAAALDRAADLVGAELEHAPLAPVIEACAPMTTAAENLVDSTATPDEVLDAWMDSPGHRANIVDPGLTEIGIGCIEHDEAQVLCSQIFLGP